MAQADHLGLSLELTAVTLALIESCLWLRPLASWLLLGTLGAAFVVEAALVTMQAWRVIISLAHPEFRRHSQISSWHRLTCPRHTLPPALQPD